MIPEKETKTTAEIYQGYDECHYDKFHGSQRWVSISYHKERVTALEAAYDEAAQTANTEALRIIEANKILDEYTPKFNEYGHNYDTYDAKDVANLIGLIRDALNANQKSSEVK